MEEHDAVRVIEGQWGVGGGGLASAEVHDGPVLCGLERSKPTEVGESSRNERVEWNPETGSFHFSLFYL